MTKIIINGGKPLRGTVRIGGAKNAALPLMAATILTRKPVTLENVPDLNDVANMRKVLGALGVKTEQVAPGCVSFDASGKLGDEAPYELVNTMRASFFVIGPLLARLGRARIPLPGGCAIGARPVNIHLKGFEALGAKVSIEGGCVVAVADKLVGTKILLDFPSVGATENLIMAAIHAEGTTVIENAAQEPEIIDLANFLNVIGASIHGAGTPQVTITGVKELGGTTYRIIPDRIEAGTFLVLGAITGGPITVQNCQPSHLDAVTTKLKEMGATIEIRGNDITVTAAERLEGVEFKTLPFPGFPTDMQSQFMVAMCLAEGTSLITESVFENRFMHVSELSRMGANLNIRERTVVVNGVDHLTGAPVSATDLRAGAAMVLAGLVAHGTTEISHVFHIDRGYENLIGRIVDLSGDICRLDENGDSENNQEKERWVTKANSLTSVIKHKCRDICVPRNRQIDRKIMNAEGAQCQNDTALKLSSSYCRYKQ